MPVLANVGDGPGAAKAADARADGARRVELARRAASTAGMGAGLTAETAGVARAAGH